MTETLNCYFYLPWHGEVDFLFFIVSIKCESNVFFPSRYSAISWCSLSTLMSWLACSLPWYFTRRSSTTRVEHIWRHFCFHKLGVGSLFTYPCFDHCSSKNCCSRSPACKNPYIPVIILAYTHPSFLDFLLIPYSLMTSSGKLFVSFGCIHTAPVVFSGKSFWYLAS